MLTLDIGSSALAQATSALTALVEIERWKAPAPAVRAFMPPELAGGLSSLLARSRMRIKLAENFRAVFYAPFYAAYALGFYAREGVELELLPSPAPAAAASALLDGTIDLTWGGPMRVMKARDEKADSPLVCFCEVVARDPFFLVGRADPSTFQLADLWRMRLATVSEVPTPWLCLPA